MGILKNIQKPSQLFSLLTSDTIDKGHLFKIIQFSKQKDNAFWEGPNWIINNTPQQGINWIGSYPNLKGVIIKTKKGSYADDGWRNTEKTLYSYSFKARNEKINLNDTANKALINQPERNYPIILFTELSGKWEFQGYFKVIDIYEKSVLIEKVTTLCDLSQSNDHNSNNANEKAKEHTEGNKRYITHIIAERNKNVISEVKEKNDWICDVCDIEYLKKYNKKYIEAHHKVPLHTFQEQHIITSKDFVLLCPNCHKAVHLYLREENLSYDQAKTKIKNLLKSS